MNKKKTLILGLFLIGFFIIRRMASGGSPSLWLEEKLIILPAILIGLSFHEAAHGFVSYWLGDNTPKIDGRLSLNPVRHIDPIGLVSLFLLGFGWGRPVAINPSSYKRPRLYEFLVSIAGVITNLIIAFISFCIYYQMMKKGYAYADGLAPYVVKIMEAMVTINLVLMTFNLLPIPPLDGFSILTQLFNLRQYEWYYILMRNGFFILMILVFTGALSNIMRSSMIFFLNVFYQIIQMF